MNIRLSVKTSLAAGLIAAGTVYPGGAFAQESVSESDLQEVTGGQPERFSLVVVDGDVLRVDRQTGTVSVCGQKNDAWRCNPVPQAEEAYQLEINELSAEVDRLTARLEELGDDGSQGLQIPPGAAIDPKGQNSGQDAPDAEAPSSGLTKKDEEELDKVLTFTESAMRRFFGMVRDLQKDLDGSEN